jgi:hypothetical protein
MGRDNNSMVIPDALKLRGEENYPTWKQTMRDWVEAHDLVKYIHATAIAPEYVDEFATTPPDPEKLRVWKEWIGGDAKIRMAI